jgi:hypothetical protein
MAEGVVQLFQLTAKDNVSGTVKAINKNLETLRNNLIAEANAVGMSAKQYDLYQASLAGATRDQKAHIAQIHDELSARRATIAMTKAHVEALKMNATVMRNSGSAAGFMNGQLRFMRGGLGQVGHQIQDIAVQLQMGQNAMLIFGQQGSQIASLFGKNGALIGAVLAVGAAIATAMVPGLFSASKAMKDLDEKSDNLIDRFDELSTALKAVAILKAKEQIDEYNQAIKKLEEDSANAVATNENLSGQMSRNRKSTLDLTAATQDYQTKILLAKEAIVELTNKTDDRTDKMDKYLNRMREEIAVYGLEGVALAEHIALTENATDIDRAMAIELAEQKERLEAKTEAEKAATKAAKEDANAKLAQQKSVDGILNSLKEQTEKLEGGARAQDLYRLKALGATEGEIMFANAIHDSIDELRAKTEAELKASRAAEAAKNKTRSDFGALQTDLRSELESPEEQLRTQLETRRAIINEMAALETEDKNAFDQARIDAETAFNQAMDALATERAATQLAAAATVISSFQSQISAMASMVDEGSALGKAFYLAQQAMAAGMAIIKGYEAAMAIKASMSLMGPAGIAASPAMEAAAISMGYVTAAMIAGQTLASFAGGGYTGDGARSGGLDGQGGRLAMIHPRETILDHTKGQGVGGNVTNININNNVDAAGAGPEVDIKIKAAMERTNAATISTIQDLMRRRRFA